MAGEKILLVEDDPDIRKLTTLSLKVRGRYNLITASDGEEGLKMAAEHRPDLILLDMVMPRVDGLETCRRLKAHPDTRSIPVVFLSGRSKGEQEQAGRSAGAEDFLYKPFDPLKLPSQVGEILERLKSRGT